MRSWDIVYSDDKHGRPSYFTVDYGFKDLRKYLIDSVGFFMQRGVILDLVDICDDVRAMKDGETMYLIASRMNVFRAPDIKQFNGIVKGASDVARWHRREREEPDAITAVKITKGPFAWKAETLFAEERAYSNSVECGI